VCVCVYVMLVEIFWSMGVEKKSPDTFHWGKFRPRHLYTHRPYLDLDFRICNWKMENRMT
jgi:hypothetical protein